MTLDEMSLKLVEHNISLQTIDHDDPYDWRRKPYDLGKDVLMVTWEIGGAEGGNCWRDNQARKYVTGNPVPDFDVFDDALLVLCPDLKHSQFTEIAKKVVVQDTDTDSEYYGNYTEYGRKYVYLDQLHKTLKEMELI